MKWLIGFMVALLMVSSAFAGEDPYIGIVGNDAIPGFIPNSIECPVSGSNVCVGNPFYFSPKHQQFLFDQLQFDVPVCFGSFPPVVTQTRVGGVGCEQFRSNGPANQPEICDTTGTVGALPGSFTFFGEPNAVVRAGNQGFFEWYIRLPKKPSGEINIVLQCGVLKPNTFAFEGFGAVELCAAETGERIASGCSRQEVDPGQNPLIVGALPKITAIAYPGPFTPYPDFTVARAFNLTAFRNPGTYNNITETLTDNQALQVLNGTAATNNATRILLKSCLDKTIVTKIPVTGQINALGQTEFDLEAGDLIYVRLDIPRANTVDIYCHSQSARIAGIGEAPF